MLADQKFPEGFRSVYADEGEADEREVDATMIGEVTSAPLRTVFAFELEERFIAIDAVEVFEQELDYFFLGLESVGSMRGVGEGGIAEADVIDSLGAEIEDRLDENKIHDVAAAGERAHEVEGKAVASRKRAPGGHGEGFAGGVECDANAVLAYLLQ